jgi:transmembrane sensor
VSQDQTPLRETAAAIDAAAAAWAARVDRAPLTAEETQALEAWAAADPRRQGALARAQAISVHFDRAQALGAGFEPHRHPVARGQSRRQLLAFGGVGIAAAVAGVVGYGGLSLRGRLTTRKGDIRRTSLSDGSAVTLNTATTLRTAIDDRRRRVELLRGEALFDVARDTARPFVVVAGLVSVRAVGTSFTVRRRDDDAVEVVVREGVVEVTRPGQTAVRLAADHTVLVPVDGPAQPAQLPAGHAERAMAWRQGLLDLDGLTLAEAAEEYARYTDRRIHIDDPAIAGLKVTGLFSISDPDGFARAAALSLGLTVTPAPDGVRLQSAAS